MNRTTGAQRRNKKLDDIWEIYLKQEAAKKDFLPTCSEYSVLLEKATEKFKISMDEARNKYGKYTCGQWKELLGLF